VSKLLFHLSALISAPLMSKVGACPHADILPPAGNATDPEGQDVGVQCLEGALRVEKVRTMVWAAEGKDSDAPKVVEG
jgi:hypothetical protein